MLATVTLLNKGAGRVGSDPPENCISHLSEVKVLTDHDGTESRPVLGSNEVLKIEHGFSILNKMLRETGDLLNLINC